LNHVIKHKENFTYPNSYKKPLTYTFLLLGGFLLGAFVIGRAYVWEAFVLDPKIRMISDPDINQETREVVESIFNHQYIIYTQK
jgi:hypothetical protein